MTNQTTTDTIALKSQCYALAHNIVGMAVGGQRDMAKVVDVLQVVKNLPNFDEVLRAPVEATQDTDAIWPQLLELEKLDRRFFPDHVGQGYGGLLIPRPFPGENWPIVGLPGLGANAIVERMRREFKVWTYRGDLDGDVRSDRNAVSRPYVALIRANVEADAEFAGKSALDTALAQTPCITLVERLRVGFSYWALTGKHLDEKTVTRCDGSRISFGRVPFVYRDDGQVHVDWCDPRNADAVVRPRAVSSAA